MTSQVAFGARREATRIVGDRDAGVYEPTSTQVEAALRVLPSHGWTAGWTGRRDRALLTLSKLAGLTFGNIAELTAGDVTVAGGVATISTPGGRTKLHAVDDDLLCGPCALARWVHALDLTIVYPDGRVIAALIARAMPVTAESPHLCQSNNKITEVTAQVTLLPPIDQWGHPIRQVVKPIESRKLTRPSRTVVPLQGPRRNGSADSYELVDRAQALERRVVQLIEDTHSGR
ncbi:MAG: hypothetical protein ABWZ02_13275 [Nakamurella sp.]